MFLFAQSEVLPDDGGLCLSLEEGCLNDLHKFVVSFLFRRGYWVLPVPQHSDLLVEEVFNYLISVALSGKMTLQLFRNKPLFFAKVDQLLSEKVHRPISLQEINQNSGWLFKNAYRVLLGSSNTHN